MAADEVQKYANSKDKKQYKINSLWTEWNKSAVKCYDFTVKVKLGLYCSVCQGNTNTYDFSLKRRILQKD